MEHAGQDPTSDDEPERGHEPAPERDPWDGAPPPAEPPVHPDDPADQADPDSWVPA